LASSKKSFVFADGFPNEELSEDRIHSEVSLGISSTELAQIVVNSEANLDRDDEGKSIEKGVLPSSPLSKEDALDLITNLSIQNGAAQTLKFRCVLK